MASTDPIAELEIAGTAFDVSELFGRVELSAPFVFDVMAGVVEDPPALADLLGQPAKLTLRDTFEQTLVVGALVTRAERVVGAQGGATFVLQLEPETAPLAIGRNSRVFQEMSVVDAVKKVLETAGIAADKAEWAVNGSPAKRPYIAQHRESDWKLVERLLSEEGIFYRWDFGDDATKVVFSDDSTAAPDVDGDAELPFSDDDALAATRDAVLRVKRSQSLTSDKVRIRDYNFDKPRLSLDSQSGSGKYEVYDFPGRFAEPSQGDRFAGQWVEALRARRSLLSGECSGLRLRPGLIFELSGHPAASLNGRLLVVGVDYRASSLRGGASRAGGVHVAFRAIPADTPFRPPRGVVTKSPGGPQTGVVVGPSGEEIHPDKSGRIRVQFYWDREGKKDDKASTWMRVGQFPLGGSMVLPRIGWDLLVSHHEGDIDAPVVTSHLYDGEHPVPYALPANKTRTAWQTATTPGGGSTNEARFEDKKGSEEMFLNASKDMNVVIGDNKDEKIGVDLTEEVGSNLSTKIGSNMTIGVKSNQDVSIGASESLTVSGARQVQISGSETITIGASRTASIVGGETITATGGRSLTVGGSMTGVAAMGVDRTVMGSLSVTVGGAWISAAATGLDNATGGAASETVGGAKIAAAAKGVDLSVYGALAETVGGAYVIAAGGNVSEQSSGALAITVGGAFLANAPTIEIEAESEITVRVGGASLTIKSSSIELKAPTIAAPGATIVKKASRIEHN